jgi:thiol-disulfide isomerase/thioredoxin
MLALSGCQLFNKPPVPSFTRSPSSGEAPLSVFFDASASVDPDGIILSHDWVFGDGATAIGETATRTYSEAGVYQATLTVTDDDGAQSELSRMIDVRSAGQPPETGSAIGQLAPDFTLANLEGNPVTLSDLRGYVVLLDFWGSWCTPCRLTMPNLETLRSRFADDGLVVVAVNLDVSEMDARTYIEAEGYTEFIVLRGSLAEAEAVKTDLYGVDGIPHTFLIDRQGVIRHADHPIRLRDRHIEPWL